MENLYNRVENLDELIRSVKLPYLAWKVLFLVNKKANSEEIAGLLETDEEAVSNSMQLLIQNGLIIVDEEPEKVVEEVEEEIAEVGHQEEDEIPEIVEVEEEVEETADSIEEPEDAPIDNQQEEQPAANILEELLEESDEQDSELEEEKIEINIPEGDEGDDISDEMEFNFNLTGEEKTEGKAAEQAPVVEQEEALTDTSGYKKMLVIDDSLVIRKMVEIALEEEEFTIETAVSGKEGLEVMDQTNPDLVILDMMLPDINGIEILKTIKASKGIPVIMLSGKDSPQMIETAKNEGAEEFLPKPFKDDDLVEKIKKII